MQASTLVVVLNDDVDWIFSYRENNPNHCVRISEGALNSREKHQQADLERKLEPRTFGQISLEEIPLSLSSTLRLLEELSSKRKRILISPTCSLFLASLILDQKSQFYIDIIKQIQLFFKINLLH